MELGYEYLIWFAMSVFVTAVLGYMSWVFWRDSSKQMAVPLVIILTLMSLVPTGLLAFVGAVDVIRWLSL